MTITEAVLVTITSAAALGFEAMLYADGFFG